jgi:hypothetical protein
MYRGMICDDRCNRGKDGIDGMGDGGGGNRRGTNRSTEKKPL